MDSRVKIVDGGLYFLFSLFTLFYFPLRFIGHAVTSVTSDGIVT